MAGRSEAISIPSNNRVPRSFLFKNCMVQVELMAFVRNKPENYSSKESVKSQKVVTVSTEGKSVLPDRSLGVR